MFEIQPEEKWLPIPGHEGEYEVSNTGRVRRLVSRDKGVKPGILKRTRRPDGYYSVGLHGENWLVHRLVLTAFVGPASSSMHGAHLSGDKSDNRLLNLVWATPSENAAHRRIHGTDFVGERNPQAKINERIVRAIRRDYRPYSKTSCCAALGRRYGLTYQTVWQIVKRRNWKHVA